MWVTHIKEALVPHPSGVSARERIMEELNALERERQLGVVFVDIRRGDRIRESFLLYVNSVQDSD